MSFATVTFNENLTQTYTVVFIEGTQNEGGLPAFFIIRF